MARPAILLVEDDERTRKHLARALESVEEVSLLAAVGTCAEARCEMSRATVDILLTDLGLPDGNGIELIRELRARSPRSQAMVVTVFGDEKNVIASIEAGAQGYLMKDASHTHLAESLRQLLAGGSPISPSIARHLLRRLRPSLPPSAEPSAEPSPEETRPALSARETEVLQLIAKGFSFPEIAEILAISVHTVTTHVRNTYKKLEVNSRGEAVYEALQLGLIEVDG
jgi:DNA-binding NarL/FixJ family response regulator